ncbi:DUF1905 domain-containing protein [Algoriphagus marincola]|uniref:DUF1905 domain-containing protein n=1 Tax=Algoriphagus marincola TaxID=264027 RepID=A0ABS7N5N1_9BACT|nr:DUF1905 domain-containing protein [Algoriphagus marincola]MBY5951613.1 DUF1905 domain-containing protein [Algoriphagus marincola]
MQGKIRYDFSAQVWKSPGMGGWVFVSLPQDLSQEIREHLSWQEEGWGRMKAKAEIKGFEWDTAIWFDKKHDTYLLPLKADIRKKTQVNVGDTISLRISL